MSLNVSEPQNRTFATRTASPRLAPQAENVMKINSKQGLRETLVQKNKNRVIRADRVAASRMNKSVRTDGWASRKNKIIVIRRDIMIIKKV